jgi:hypothetical protein
VYAIANGIASAAFTLVVPGAASVSAAAGATVPSLGVLTGAALGSEGGAASSPAMSGGTPGSFGGARSPRTGRAAVTAPTTTSTTSYVRLSGGTTSGTSGHGVSVLDGGGAVASPADVAALDAVFAVGSV